MPVATTSNIHFFPGAGQPPGAPTQVTSITRDAAATVTFRAPSFTGDGPVTSWTVTPYIGAAAQAPTTVAAASAGTITDSAGTSYRQVAVTGLANSTAYTFTVKAANSAGTGPESAASGANTPLQYLVFGDDFNGPAGAQPDPEWWVYDRCGFIAQNEVQWYKPDHCVLDGAGNLKITASHDPVSGVSYPSDNNTVRNQTWTSGACQSNTKTWYPAAGNTMTYEARFQVNPNAGDGFWPGFFWLNGQYALTAWKTDPGPNQWNGTDHAEIDIAEWYQSGAPGNYGNVTWSSSSPDSYIHDYGVNLSLAMHTYTVQWKPGARTRFLRDGSETHLYTGAQVPSSGAQFVLLLYMQMLGGGPTGTESIYTDWVRVYDQNLG